MLLSCDGAILVELLLLPRPLLAVLLAPQLFTTAVGIFLLVTTQPMVFLTLQDFLLEVESLQPRSLLLAPINPPILLVPVYPS